MSRPQESEYPSPYHTYISQVPDGDIIKHYHEQLDRVLVIMKSIPEEKGSYAYAEGKWSIKELFVHITDAERIFAYRALRFARKDQTPLPGFEENDFAKESKANARKLSDIIEEFRYVRLSSIALFSSFDENVRSSTGKANGKPITVNAIMYSVVGHLNHHMRILQERYLV